MPNGTCGKSCHGTSEPWFLPSGRDAEVDVILEPFVCHLIPCFEVGFVVLGCFEGERGNVCHAIPFQCAVGVVSVEA